MKTVLVLHPGQMGAAIGAQARRGGVRVLWCPGDRGRATARRAAEAGFEPAPDLGQAVAAADVVMSIVPPAAAEETAERVAAAGVPRIYLEANAISPRRAERIAALFPRQGFVDGCVIGPPPGDRVSVRLYLSGPQATVEAIGGLFHQSAVETVALGETVGGASALKMAYGSYQKTSRALAAVSHALAAHHGVERELLAEAERMAPSALAEPGHLPGVASRAWRWAPEMAEVAHALRAANLPADLALAAEEILHRWDPDKDATDLTLDEVLSHLRDPSGED
ncbi:NAD(P)-dependent oxidoreductase [Spongiactinospora gelatinilytica]|uniref:NAD(P)-dependent oxidoreductase n=1 Tax=Spongiactinospora gelatinilytica TaxID=2666298 RepID=A0A2W2FCY5_9ACTN|nr:NAD(P)-dependent oxidoreductase [Spongiactinospora gelatinilytica]PZG33513.1 NAD(P)-dependent oxidoreductase [Spongiactinospora gelatinilytica]